MGAIQLVPSPENYSKPYRRAWGYCRLAERLGTLGVFGAESRYNYHSQVREHLTRYDEELSNRLERGDMLGLPSLWADERGFARLFQLSVGPFEGLFRLEERGTVAFGALFVASLSRSEDDLARLMEAEGLSL